MYVSKSAKVKKRGDTAQAEKSGTKTGPVATGVVTAGVVGAGVVGAGVVGTGVVGAGVVGAGVVGVGVVSAGVVPQAASTPSNRTVVKITDKIRFMFILLSCQTHHTS